MAKRRAMVLLNLADIARELGVSRQRAHQLAADDPHFPEPVGSVGGRMSVWTKRAVRAYAQARKRRLEKGLPMTVNPDLNVTALIDPYDEESGSELSAHGKQVVEEKLRAIGYAHVTFIGAAEMAQHVAANNGKWVKPDSRPVEGWTYYDAPDAEVLVDGAGIDFTDDAMWND